MAPGPRGSAVAMVALLAVLAGCSVAIPPQDGTGPSLSAAWVSHTGTDISGNHHAIAAGRVDGEPVVLLPLGGSPGGHDHAGGGGTDHTHAGCELVALDGAGEVRWREGVPPANCTIHAVADPTLADATGDGRAEALAASTANTLVAYGPLSGERRYAVPLTGYGYAKPVVGDVTGDDRPETVAVDVRGTAVLVGPDGSRHWTAPLGAITWAPPAIVDRGAAPPRIVVGVGDGRVVGLTPGGDTAWTVNLTGGVIWSATGDIDGDGTREYLASTVAGQVAAVEPDGTVRWRRSVGRLAAVGGVADGDGDGTPEVYVTARDGHLRALAAPDGDLEWNRSLQDEPAQMTPPPSVGDLDGDGRPEVVAPTNHGAVHVVDPTDGAIRATYRRDVPIYTHATLADTDGDGSEEIYVPYGDGRAVALVYRSSSASS